LEYHSGVKRCNLASLALFGLLLVPALLVSKSEAQRSGGHAGFHGVPSGHSVAPHSGSRIQSLAYGRNNFPSRYRQPFGYGAFAWPFLDDGFTLDDLYSSGYPVASAPPEFLLQAARSLPGSPDYASQAGGNHEGSATQPLMIELQNGRYVQVKGTAIDGEARELPNELPNDEVHASVTSATHDLPPAVLVFRDGHSEQVRDYTIADGVLYARGDYYTDGYWNKNIALSTLNVPQTLQANAARNMKFVLPSSPNEVITRP